MWFQTTNIYNGSDWTICLEAKLPYSGSKGTGWPFHSFYSYLCFPLIHSSWNDPLFSHSKLCHSLQSLKGLLHSEYLCRAQIWSCHFPTWTIQNLTLSSQELFKTLIWIINLFLLRSPLSLQVIHNDSWLFILSVLEINNSALELISD